MVIFPLAPDQTIAQMWSNVKLLINRKVGTLHKTPSTTYH